MGALKRLVVLSPFGVYPPRSGGHSAVLEPALQLSRSGIAVYQFGLGIRRFEVGRHWRSFRRDIEPNFVEERHVSIWNLIDFLRRGRSGLPALGAAEFLAHAASHDLHAACVEADLLQYETPWLFGFQPADRPRVLIAHNVEATLVNAIPSATAAQRARAAALEGAAYRGASAVICLTEVDRDGLTERYGTRATHVIPLGIDTDTIRAATAEERATARERLGVAGRYVVLFTGAWHLPNADALRAIRAWAEGATGDLLYVVAGSVGERVERARNLVVTGPLRDIGDWFAAADCCINPVARGSGSNVKLMEYFGRGLPVVTTHFGARGVDAVDGEHALLRERDAIPDAVESLREDARGAAALGAAGRRLVADTRSWRAIAAERRALLETLL